MLLHDYQCKECGHIQEIDHPHYEKPKIDCPKCGGETFKRIGSAGFITRGEGFYKNGFKGSR